MSRQLIAHSPDLKQLQDEGYEVDIVSAYLVLRHVPYVTPARVVAYGMLVSTLNLAGDRTTTPDTHVVTFAGERPSHADGSPFFEIINSEGHATLAPGVVVDFTFSSKPAGGYPDYHAKMTAYANMLLTQARIVDPEVTATTFPPIETTETETVFRYIDTASSRAGIATITARLAPLKVAIVGLGGTGSYILDLVAKTPVCEIHLYDRDRLLTHNAFRAPGAATLAHLQAAPYKVDYYHALYDGLRRNILPHRYHIDASTVDELRGMNFVFLSLDGGSVKDAVVEKLVVFGVPFIDVGMGLYDTGSGIGGILRVTTSTPGQREQGRATGPSSSGAENGDPYAHNIQIAELNSLNAALAVVKFKKLFGCYADFSDESVSTYLVEANVLTSCDQSGGSGD